MVINSYFSQERDKTCILGARRPFLYLTTEEKHAVSEQEENNTHGRKGVGMHAKYGIQQFSTCNVTFF